MDEKKIDLVYLWVDGNDPRWAKKKAEFTGALFSDDSEENCIGRYISNDELKYSLRSIEKNANWINKIYIITDNQKPVWLNTDNSKIQIINHSEILPSEAIPCFNASVIELFIYKIPELSEHFLYANDDMFVYKKINSDFFFDKKGFPIVRHKRKRFGKIKNYLKLHFGKKPGYYRKMLIEAANMVEERFGKYYSGIPHHNIDAYLKSDYKICIEKIFKNEVEVSTPNHIRTDGDLNRAAFLLYALAINHGSIVHTTRKESARLLPYRHNMSEYIMKHNPTLFCLNDNERVTDTHRAMIVPFLESLFPEKSEFEL